MKTNVLKWLLACELVLVGCSNHGGIPRPQAIVNRVALQSFSSCTKLQEYIADTAVLQMRSQIEMSKRMIAVPLGGRAAGPPAAGAPADASAVAQAGPSSYTQTNVQVPGVDEADFVKNDGIRIFVLAGNKLYLNVSWPPAGLKTVGKVAVEGWPREMFLDGNQLVVFSSMYTPYPLADRAPGSMAPILCVRGSMDCGYFHNNSVKVTVLNVSDLTSPKVEQEYFLPGSYSSARRIGSSVRLVLNDGFRWPQEVKWWPDYDPAIYADKDRLAQALDALMARNEEVIKRTPLDAWLPLNSHKLPDGTLENLPYSCSDFSRTNAPTRLGIVTVATLNLKGSTGNQLTQASIIAEPGQVYASERSLFVATGHWWWWLEAGQRDFTYLHKFDITPPDRASYLASGGVEGQILNQFSMDEDSAGYFRVATNLATRGEPTAQFPWGQLQSSNRVSVLKEIKGELKVIGQSEELAPGERITSARFLGTKGFVVTVRQIDPLFTLDLSDPTHPTKVGELKVPGFSTYIHPLSDRYLLTIGLYLPDNGDWRARAVKLSMFDVADLANPREKYTQLVGTSWGWSEAAYEHRAFNYFAARKLLAIPFADRNPACPGWCGFSSDLRVFSVDPESGIVSKGALNMSDVYQTVNNDRWSYYWAPWVRRSVMADNFAYAISDAGIRVADVDALGSPIKTTVFDAPEN